MKTWIIRVLGFVISVTITFATVAQISSEQIEEWHHEAEQGIASAQYNLGVSYASGTGITQDWHEAVRWFRKAAEQGFAEAQNDLGVAYYDGIGIVQDQHKAVRWYRKAAEQGLADAQYNLGVAYNNIEDWYEAEQWFQKAADQGHKKASQGLKTIKNPAEKPKERLSGYQADDRAARVVGTTSGVATVLALLFGFLIGRLIGLLLRKIKNSLTRWTSYIGISFFIFLLTFPIVLLVMTVLQEYMDKAVLREYTGIREKISLIQYATKITVSVFGGYIAGLVYITRKISKKLHK